MDFGIPRIISIVIIVALIIAALVGFKRGFINTLLVCLKSFASFLISFFFAKPFGAVIGGLGLKAFFFKNITSFIGKNGGELLNTTLTEENFSSVMTNALNQIKIPENLHTTIINFIQNKGLVSMGITVNESISTALATFGCYIVAFVVLFIGVAIAVSLLKAIFKDINKIPVVGTVNQLLGLVLAVVFTLLCISTTLWVFQLLCTIIPSLNEVAIKAFALNDPNYLTISKFLYKYNIIIWLFSLLF